MALSPSALAPRTAQPTPARAWGVVALLCVVGCLNYLDRVMITTMRGSLVEAIPMTDAQFGLLTAVFLWVYGLLSPLAGFLADRFSRSRVIVGSLLVWSVVTWLTGYATSFGELLLTRALMGVSEACYIPAAMALIVDYHRGPTRSLATGLHVAGVMVGQSLGFVGGMIAERHAWNSAFWAFGLFGIGYALCLFFWLADPPPAAPAGNGSGKTPPVRFGEALRYLFRRRAYRLALAFWGCLGLVGWLIVGWLPTYYQEHFRLGQGEAGLYATGYLHTASLVGVLSGGALADRWSRVNPRARLLLPALGLLVAAPAVLAASLTGVLAVAVGGFVVYALTRTFSDANMMPILCLFTEPRYRATGYGVLNLFSCLVGGVGIYAGGVLRDHQVDVGVLFRVAAGLMVVCAGLLLVIRPGSPEAPE